MIEKIRMRKGEQQLCYEDQTTQLKSVVSQTKFNESYKITIEEQQRINKFKLSFKMKNRPSAKDLSL